MPRVRINKTKYMQKDLTEYIEGRRKTLGLSLADLGQELGITAQAMVNRLRKGLFGYGDMVKLFDILQSTDEEILWLMKLNHEKG